MAKVFDHITQELSTFITAQPLFFVATAPLSQSGCVNVSPKGLDSLRILTVNRVAYLDATGSGNETSAHLLENGRITLMFCAFHGKPLILRLYGQGKVVLPTSTDWQELAALFPAIPGTRQIIVIEVDRVQTSCGSGVPLMNYVGQRQEMITWAEKKGADGMKTYHQQKNLISIDGLTTPLASLFEMEDKY